MAARWRGRRGKGQGVRGSVPHGGENGEERGRGAGATGDISGGRHRPPGQRAWAAPLPRDRGGRRGMSDVGASG
jgi:hypothetical protein